MGTEEGGGGAGVKRRAGITPRPRPTILPRKGKYISVDKGNCWLLCNLPREAGTAPASGGRRLGCGEGGGVK